MIGTRGVPARYGGFETCVEEVGRRLVDRGHDVLVYSRPAYEPKFDYTADEYLGMKLIHLPVVQKRFLETLTHTALSVVHRSLQGADAALVFNAANSPLLPVVRMRGYRSPRTWTAWSGSAASGVRSVSATTEWPRAWPFAGRTH